MVKLSEYLKKHKGELIKLGSGTAFLFIGYIDDGIDLELEKIRWKEKIPALPDREVLKTYPSLPEINEGTIVIIEGAERGRYWTKGEYDYFNNNRGISERSYRFDTDMDDN